MSENKKNNPETELTDQALDQVTGGVQAGFFTQGGKSEFEDAPPQPPEETEEERKKRLMRQAEGSSFL